MYLSDKIFNHDNKIKNKSPDETKLVFKKTVYIKDDLKTFNQLVKHYSKSIKNKQINDKSFSSFGVHNKSFSSKLNNQRVTFKMSYSNTIASHKKYIDYYMPQQNKNTQIKPTLFGFDDEEYIKYITPLNFKCIISPENTNVDMELLTKTFIKKIEYNTGYSLVWKACVHKDTDHQHIHLVINGKDIKENDVFFRKETIQLMRLMCSNAATEIIGERSEEEIKESKLGLYKAKRWTHSDEIIENLSANTGKINKKNLSLEIENRLAFLSSINLAHKNSSTNSWEISSNLKNVLQAAGRYNTFFEEYCKNTKQPLLELYTSGNLKGIVEKVINFDKDEAWNDAIILNTGNKRVYIPIWQLHKENLEGQRVFITNKNNNLQINRQITDKNIHLIE